MILRGENLIKEYGPKKVVKGVSVEVSQGEIVGLLGPNGAGKTTSFYMIVGLVKPTSGKIYLDDKEITNDAMYRRAQKGIGYLAQEASVFRKLSVEDNILGVLQLTKLSKREQQIKCDELIEEFSQLTRDVLQTQNLEDFSQLMNLHEKKLSIFLGIETVSEKYFENCPSFIKSLGAWGGDFVMSSKFSGFEEYFQGKGFASVFSYRDLIA